MFLSNVLQLMTLFIKRHLNLYSFYKIITLYLVLCYEQKTSKNGEKLPKLVVIDDKRTFMMESRIKTTKVVSPT